MIGTEHQHRADALFCQKRDRGFHGHAGFNARDLTALCREYDTDGHRSLPKASLADMPKAHAGLITLNVCRAFAVPQKFLLRALCCPKAPRF